VKTLLKHHAAWLGICENKGLDPLTGEPVEQAGVVDTPVEQSDVAETPVVSSAG
jgi:hypothetical protein